ncbi:MAG: adenylate kinase [Acidimicrobiia bacterium]|nr:adenylate kinase [Acidimicrobiia bacterium]
MKLLFLGPPGAGKGTQAVRIAGRLNIPHIATGNMLREAVAAGTELGLLAKEVMARGDLVSDDLVIAMLEERIEKPDAERGFILDGFPRTIAQGEALADRMGDSALDGAVYIGVEDDEIVRRISGRRTCPNQHVYHVDDNPPEVFGVCDIDNETLVQREDDAEDVVRNRLRVYREQTEPLVEFYTSRGLRIHPVNGLGDLDEVEAAIVATLDI